MNSQLQDLNAKLAAITNYPIEINPDGKSFRIAGSFSVPSTPGVVIPTGGQPSHLDVTDWKETDFRSVTSIYASICMSPWTGSAVPCIRFDAPFEIYNNLHQSIGKDTSKAVSLHAGTPESEAREIAAIFAQLVRVNGGTPLLNEPTPAEVKAAAKQTKQSEKLYKAQLNAQQPSSPSMFATILGSIIDATAQLAASADPNGIQNATNQHLGNIQAKQAQVQSVEAQRSVATTQVARNTAPPPVAAKTAAPSSASAGSGTAPPPTCVDLGPGNCVPIAQYQQMMAQKNQQAAQMQVCPASGFVPGPGHYAACDAYIGERYFCTPGQSVPIQEPAPPPASCGGTPSTGSGGGTPVAGSKEPTENACLQMSRDAQGMPVFHNVCSFALTYFYTPVNPRKGEFKEQNGILAPGETQTGVEGNGEQVLYYACKEGDLVVGPDGAVITQAVNSFGCVKP